MPVDRLVYAFEPSEHIMHANQASDCEISCDDGSHAKHIHIHGRSILHQSTLYCGLPFISLTILVRVGFLKEF
jgi:hypothetical protein